MRQWFKLIVWQGEGDERIKTESVWGSIQGQSGTGGDPGIKTINAIAQEHGVHPAQVGTLFEGQTWPKPGRCLQRAGHQ
ncbi:protein of unknown function [Acidithiobacillus ferrivorans]|uniref:Uncharacterized protein n=1 Tax=Acidithiobacillus ferrivorans TaxID=160808 RepID=A0ABY1MTV3_9PROT|nr:protein of unknown function [Acidithiobacillus ferrivorans]